MYNLLVSSDENDWEGAPFVIKRSRCVRFEEYTDSKIAKRFGELSQEKVRELCAIPCLFAYERVRKGVRVNEPKFGVLRRVKPSGVENLQIEYQLIPCDGFAKVEDLESIESLLDIKRFELYRTHWAVKDVDLAEALRSRDIALPAWEGEVRRQVDIAKHRFKVALSFPGEHRHFVKRVAAEVEQQLGLNSCFYDKYYEAFLAQPKLDRLLEGIYGQQSDLVVVFVCAEYDSKTWCGIEWQKILERRVFGNESDIMYVRVGEGDVAGMSRLDGYLDAQGRDPKDVAACILQRAEAK